MKNQRPAPVAILVLVGVVNIPIIKYSVDSVEYSASAGQPQADRRKPSMPGRKLGAPAIVGKLAFVSIGFGWLACLRMQTEILIRENSAPAGYRICFM